MPKLVATRGKLAGTSFDIGGGATLGRSKESDIVVLDPRVSRRHVRVRCSEGDVFAEDLDSGNGTFVNDERIYRPTRLRNGDRLRVAGQEFKFVSDSPASHTSSISIEDAGPEASAAIAGSIDVKATMAKGVFPGEPAVSETRSDRRLQTIFKISNAVQTELDLMALLDVIMGRLFEVFEQADRAFLMLCDDEGVLQPAASRTRGGGAERIAVSRHIIGEVTSKGVAILSLDAMGDDRFRGGMSIADFHIRSMMCAPLIVKEDLLGIIHVDTTRNDRRFTNEDLETLSIVAAQTALAIAGAKMHERLMQRDRMERDLEIAAQVQNSFLPKRPPEAPNMEFAAWYRAAFNIGGDLYDFIPRSEESMAVVVGDVSGKGIPAALMMARISSDARFFSLQAPEPKDILTLLNGRQVESGMDEVFVTMALLTVNLRTHEILVGNAAHCMPLIRRNAEGDVIEVGGEPGLPLGVIPGYEYEQARYRLKPGDVALLVTDGVTEAMNANEQLYSEARLVKTVMSAPPSAQGVMRALLEDLQRHVGDTRQSDDLTIVCFGVQEDAPTIEDDSTALTE